MNSEPRTLLVDGTFYLHRITHLPNFAGMRTSEGRRTGGLYGFVNSLRTVLRTYRTLNRCYVCWDTGKSQRRLELHEGYKANRKLPDDAPEHKKREKEEYEQFFTEQKILIQRVLPSLGCRQLALPNREADDLIGWMVYKHPDAKVIATEDKDLYQLVYDWATVFRPIKKVKVTKEDFFALTGVPQPLWLLYRALIGDSSDNIPGLVGETVGDRLMGKVTELWNNKDGMCKLSELLSDACDIMVEQDKRNRLKYTKIKENLEIVAHNLQLMDISQEIATFSEKETQKLQSVVDSGPTYFNEEALYAELREVEFNSILDDFISWTYQFRNLS